MWKAGIAVLILALALPAHGQEEPAAGGTATSPPPAGAQAPGKGLPPGCEEPVPGMISCPIAGDPGAAVGGAVGAEGGGAFWSEFPGVPAPSGAAGAGAAGGRSPGASAAGAPAAGGGSVFWSEFPGVVPPSGAVGGAPVAGSGSGGDPRGSQAEGGGIFWHEFPGIPGTGMPRQAGSASQKEMRGGPVGGGSMHEIPGVSMGAPDQGTTGGAGVGGANMIDLPGMRGPASGLGGGSELGEVGLRGAMGMPGPASGLGGTMMNTPGISRGALGGAGMAMNRGGAGLDEGLLWMDARVPEEKREPLRAAAVRATQQMLIQQGAFQAAQLGLSEALRAFPVDRKAVQAQWRAVQAASEALLKVRVDHVAEEQKILGGALWKELHPRWRVVAPDGNAGPEAAGR